MKKHLQWDGLAYVLLLALLAIVSFSIGCGRTIWMFLVKHSTTPEKLNQQ